MDGGPPSMEPQEHSRNIVGTCLPGSCIPTIFLGCLFGFPIKLPGSEGSEVICKYGYSITSLKYTPT